MHFIPENIIRKQSAVLLRFHHQWYYRKIHVLRQDFRKIIDSMLLPTSHPEISSKNFIFTYYELRNMKWVIIFFHRLSCFNVCTGFIIYYEFLIVNVFNIE